MWRLLALLLLATPRVHADPLGESRRPGARWSSAPLLQVTPVLAVSRHGHIFVYQWDASMDGMAIDHDRFYELVDRPDLARRVVVRRTLGVLAIAGGLALGALGADQVLHDRAWGAGLYLGGGLVAFGGAYLVIEADPTSASEADQLAGTHMLGFGGRF